MTTRESGLYVRTRRHDACCHWRFDILETHENIGGYVYLPNMIYIKVVRIFGRKAYKITFVITRILSLPVKIINLRGMQQSVYYEKWISSHTWLWFPKITCHIVLQYCMMTSSNWSNFRVTSPLCGEFTGQRWIPHTKAQWRGALMFSFICAWINGWVNNRKAGDLRRQQAHYDVIVMGTMASTFSGGLIDRAVHDEYSLLVDFFIDNERYFHNDIS